MRVLVVDDDGDSRAILRMALEHCGHEVMETGRGSDVLPLARQHPFDAVLMDLEVPGMDGWETTRALRGDPETAHIPVIAVSAHALPAHRARARAVGCVSYLTKPVEPLAVVREVEGILRRAAAAAASSAPPLTPG